MFPLNGVKVFLCQILFLHAALRNGMGLEAAAEENSQLQTSESKENNTQSEEIIDGFVPKHYKLLPELTEYSSADNVSSDEFVVLLNTRVNNLQTLLSELESQLEGEWDQDNILHILSEADKAAQDLRHTDLQSVPLSKSKIEKMEQKFENIKTTVNLLLKNHEIDRHDFTVLEFDEVTNHTLQQWVRRLEMQLSTFKSSLSTRKYQLETLAYFSNQLEQIKAFMNRLGTTNIPDDLQQRVKDLEKVTVDLERDLLNKIRQEKRLLELEYVLKSVNLKLLSVKEVGLFKLNELRKTTNEVFEELNDPGHFNSTSDTIVNKVGNLKQEAKRNIFKIHLKESAHKLKQHRFRLNMPSLGPYLLAKVKHNITLILEELNQLEVEHKQRNIAQEVLNKIAKVTLNEVTLIEDLISSMSETDSTNKKETNGLDSSEEQDTNSLYNGKGHDAVVLPKGLVCITPDSVSLQPFFQKITKELEDRLQVLIGDHKLQSSIGGQSVEPSLNFQMNISLKNLV